MGRIRVCCGRWIIRGGFVRLRGGMEFWFSLYWLRVGWINFDIKLYFVWRIIIISFLFRGFG